jgi:hypothetical protein
MLYRYMLHGNDACEAHYAVLIEPGETVWTGDGRHLRVFSVVPNEEEDSPFVGVLVVEPHDTATDIAR